MELYQLQYFIEVARNRNFTRAAKRWILATRPPLPSACKSRSWKKN